MIILGSKEVIHAFYSANKILLVLSSIRTNNVKYTDPHSTLQTCTPLPGGTDSDEKGCLLASNLIKESEKQKWLWFLCVVYSTAVPIYPDWKGEGGGGLCQRFRIGLYTSCSPSKGKKYILCVYMFRVLHFTFTFPTSRAQGMLFLYTRTYYGDTAN